MKKVFLISFLLLILFGCSKNKETQKVRIAALKGPSAMGMIKMIDSIKQNKDSNIEIEIYNEPIQVRKLMLENEVDITMLPTTMGAILYNKNIPYKLAAIPVWGTLYLFGRDSTIHSWNDLKGKRIHLMAKGMTPDVLFKDLLIKNGIDTEKDVILDYSFPTHIDLANAVASNQAELAVISEPLVSMVMQKNKTVNPVFDLNKEWKKVHDNIPIAQTALLVNTSFAENQSTDLKKVLNSYRHSTNWVNENPEQAAKLIVKYKILPNEEVAVLSIPRSSLQFEEAKNIKDQVKNYLEIFYRTNPNIIGGNIPDDNFFMN